MTEESLTLIRGPLPYQTLIAEADVLEPPIGVKFVARAHMREEVRPFCKVPESKYVRKGIFSGCIVW